MDTNKKYNFLFGNCFHACRQTWKVDVLPSSVVRHICVYGSWFWFKMWYHCHYCWHLVEWPNSLHTLNTYIKSPECDFRVGRTREWWSLARKIQRLQVEIFSGPKTITRVVLDLSYTKHATKSVFNSLWLLSAECIHFNLPTEPIMTSPYHSARCVKLFREITSATLVHMDSTAQRHDVALPS
jgi:DNA-directed RNA polymerase subunit RPC12/RpoP